jgi:hypothetical protein
MGVGGVPTRAAHIEVRLLSDFTGKAYFYIFIDHPKETGIKDP